MTRRLSLMDIRDLVRHLRLLESDREVQRFTGLHRKTIKRYRGWAAKAGLLQGELPDQEHFKQLVDQSLKKPLPPQNLSSVEPYRILVESWVAQQVEGQAIWQRLVERGYSGSVYSVYRFLKQLKKERAAAGASGSEKAVVRVERKPGEEAQVDFGYVGEMIDGETGQIHKSYAFVMTLSYSRHLYVEFVAHQNLANWLLCQRHAFEFFGGVVNRLVIDNLKPAISQTSWDGTEAQPTLSYRQFVEHYGFLIAPCRPYTPAHKGKVESSVHYVQRNFMGGRQLTTFSQANQEVKAWCRQIAGLRQHGTTHQQPLRQFEQVELAALRPLPTSPYELAEWKQLKVHRDCYVTFDYAYYSVPHRLIGQQVWVCGTSQSIKIYNREHQLEATHSRAHTRGERFTQGDHLPPTKKAGLLQSRELVLTQAQGVGPATVAVVEELLADPVVDRLPTASKVVRLAQRGEVGAARLEAACARAITFGEAKYRTIRRILDQRLEEQALPSTAATVGSKDQEQELVANTAVVGESSTSRYGRSATEILGALFRSTASVVLVGVVSLVGRIWL